MIGTQRRAAQSHIETILPRGIRICLLGETVGELLASRRRRIQSSRRNLPPPPPACLHITERTSSAVVPAILCSCDYRHLGDRHVMKENIMDFRSHFMQPAIIMTIET